jgi:hypothetical protein
MTEKGQSEIRIPGVSNKLKSDIKSIASDMGITVAGFLKPKLREIVNDHLKNKRQF